MKYRIHDIPLVNFPQRALLMPSELYLLKVGFSFLAAHACNRYNSMLNSSNLKLTTGFHILPCSSLTALPMRTHELPKNPLKAFSTCWSL